MRWYVAVSITFVWYRRYQLINQSIKQTNFYSTNILGEARLSGVTAKSVFSSKIEETVS